MEGILIWLIIVGIIGTVFGGWLLGPLAIEIGSTHAVPAFARSTAVVLIAGMLTACGSGITEIKYVYHKVGNQIVRPADQEVLTAPVGKHYAVFLINCIDNASRDDSFGFKTTRLRAHAGNSQITPLSGQFPPYQETVAAGAISKGVQQNALAKTVFLLDGDPAPAIINNLFYDTQGDESVLMVNQTVYGPLVSTGGPIDYSSISGSPFFKNTDLCADSGSYH